MKPERENKLLKRLIDASMYIGHIPPNITADEARYLAGCLQGSIDKSALKGRINELTRATIELQCEVEKATIERCCKIIDETLVPVEDLSYILKDMISAYGGKP